MRIPNAFATLPRYLEKGLKLHLDPAAPKQGLVDSATGAFTYHLLGGHELLIVTEERGFDAVFISNRDDSISDGPFFNNANSAAQLDAWLRGEIATA